VRIKAGTSLGCRTTVFKDGVDISSRCTEVERDGSIAILFAQDKDGNFYVDESGEEIAKEVVRDVIVTIQGEENE
jgi:hypothetical protein